MPRTFVTEKTMPVILHELDRWKGKLTWDLFTVRLAKVLGEESIGRHALLKYPQIVQAFNDRKAALKEKAKTTATSDFTLEAALSEIEVLKAKNDRLEKLNALYKEQFVRWLENLRAMPNVDLVRLSKLLDKPLPKVDRR